MRVEYRTNGVVAGTYFPGLSAPVVLHSDELPEHDAHELQRLVDDACFFNQPATPNATARPADRRQYTITVEDHQHRHTVYLADPITDAELQSLVAFLNGQASAPGSAAPSAHYPAARRRGVTAVSKISHIMYTTMYTGAAQWRP